MEERNDQELKGALAGGELNPRKQRAKPSFALKPRICVFERDVDFSLGVQATKAPRERQRQ